MAVFYGNNKTQEIVSSGLIAHWDAGNSSSYSGSGSTWNDISGSGYSATLVNSPTFISNGQSSFFRFNGTNQYATTTYLQPIYTTTTNLSYNSWIFSNKTEFPPIFGNRNNVLQFVKLNSNKFEYYPNSGITTMVEVQMPVNLWVNVCIVIENGVIKYFLNSFLMASLPILSATTQTLPFFIGGDNTALEYSSTDIAIVSVYNKALSQLEVSQNFAAVRSRYMS